MDLGGPKREFFRLLMSEAANSLLVGKSNMKFFYLDATALQVRINVCVCVCVRCTYVCVWYICACEVCVHVITVQYRYFKGQLTVHLHC